MSKILKNPLTLALTLLSLAVWAYSPRLWFFVGRALDEGVHVPGEMLYWVPILFPPMSWLMLWYSQMQKSAARRLMLMLACLLILASLAVVGILLWQYSRCGMPIVAASTGEM